MKNLCALPRANETARPAGQEVVVAGVLDANGYLQLFDRAGAKIGRILLVSRPPLCGANEVRRAVDSDGGYAGYHRVIDGLIGSK